MKVDGRMKINLCIYTLVALVFMCSCGLKYDKEQEKNDSVSTAQVIHDGKPLRGLIDSAGDIDFYRLSSTMKDITGDVLADIAVTEQGDLDLMIVIYSDGKIVKIVNDTSHENGTVGKGERIVNALFSRDEVKSGSAVFSLQRVDADTENSADFDQGQGAVQSYELSLKVKSRQEQEEGEPNDKAVSATECGPHSMMKGYFNPSVNLLNIKSGTVGVETDWYSFSIISDDMVKVSVSHSAVPDVDSRLSVYDQLGYLLRESNSHGLGEPEKLMNLGLNRGQYFIRLESAVPYHQNYSVGYLLKIEEDESWDGEYESNDRYPVANAITFSSDMRGFFNPTGDIDWFRFNVYDSNRQIITIRVSPTADTDPVLELYSFSADLILSINDRGIDEGEIMNNIGVEAGVYYVKIYNNDEKKENTNDPYTLVVEKRNWEPEEEFELNNDRDTADPIGVGHIKRGFVTPKGDRDFYTFYVHQPSEMSIETTPCVLLDLAFNVYRENGELLAHINKNPIEEREKERLFLEQGNYFIEVFSINGRENSRDAYLLKIFS
jgi:hypothetical protein